MKGINLPRLKDRFSKETFSIGLDIGSSSIKLIKLKFTKDKIEFCGFDLEPTQVDLGPLLKKIAESCCDTKKINLSVSGPSTIIRYVDFPRMNEDELRHALKFEAEKHVPFSMPEINLDSYILKQDLPDNKMLIMLAAAKKEFINQRLKLIEDIGLKVNIVDIDSLALINAFNFNYSQDENLKGKTIALLNIGAGYSNLNILESGIPRLSRDIRIAGNNFTQKIQDTLGVDFATAEALKLKSEDKEQNKKITPAVELIISNLANEVRISFDYYESQSTSSAGKIFLSGGGSRLLALKDTLANLIGIEVEYWDPLKQIVISDTIDASKIKEISSHLAVAVGLALRRQ